MLTMVKEQAVLLFTCGDNNLSPSVAHRGLCTRAQVMQCRAGQFVISFPYGHSRFSSQETVWGAWELNCVCGNTSAELLCLEAIVSQLFYGHVLQTGGHCCC